MAHPFEVPDAKVKEAVQVINKFSNAATASRLLKEIGSCGWESLVSKSDGKLSTFNAPYPHFAFEEHGDTQTLIVFGDNTARTTPFASVTDTSCESKEK